tara:strand:- start:5499 stop:6131 length:633 start_codon:yes stop_codon:yes gene_type:complete
LNKKTEITFFENDLDQDFFDLYSTSNSLAIDTEAMGLIHGRDRLCLIQICNELGNITCIKLAINNTNSKKLKTILESEKITKIFHFARFDVAALKCNLSIEVKNIFCTKIASKLARTYSPKHGLKELINEMCGIELDKKYQSSDWGSTQKLSQEQLNYASNDVKYLINARNKLEIILKREGRMELAQKCFDCIPTFADLDIGHYQNIFEH